MTYWSWEAGALALAGVMLLHWLATGRMMAVSGRFTALVNRARLGPQEAAPEMEAAELIAAMRAATVEEFGAHAVESIPPGELETGGVATTRPAETQGLPDHLLFLGALVVGGLASSLLAGRFHFTMGLASAGFARITRGSGVTAASVLVLGGLFVGFGTRMAGGCTSGHGMCGVSRLQRGSLLATVAFFGTGVATAFAMGWLR
jgi:uncharacterized membrane protein YedE/YeeE